MITPRFDLNQNENTVSINIRAPYCDLKQLEIFAEDETFTFTCAPYHLRLCLPGRIVDNDSSHSSFDADSGAFTFTYEKAVSGEHFPDLDLITKLLQKKVDVEEVGRKIEVLSETSTEEIEADLQYGFGMRGGYNLSGVAEEFKEVFDVNPCEIKLEDRRGVRLKIEVEKFDADHYLGDLDWDQIDDLLKLDLPWKDTDFTGDELDFLKDLQNVDHKLTDSQRNFAWNGLIDILFAYCYDRRTTYFEGTCESGWTINKVAATLCCFEGFNDEKNAVISGFRRGLMYPYYRQFNLCVKILDDLKFVLNLGRKFLIKCLIDIRGIFIKGDCPRYILNNLFIHDYIVFLSNVEVKEMSEIAEKVHAVIINKGDLDLNLDSLENEFLVSQMNNLILNSDSEDSDNLLDSDDENIGTSSSESTSDASTSET